MRGKELKSPKLRTKTGITPAYAGKSCRSAFTFSTMSDHPRLCGEKNSHHDHSRLQEGSPPPMRGKVRYVPAGSVYLRITPAYAGKRGFPTVPFLFLRDHPRLCGEKACFFPLCISELGSPPPMRGKVHGERTSQNSRRDHPRLCGEKQYLVHSFCFTPGITPAYAGKSVIFQRTGT